MKVRSVILICVLVAFLASCCSVYLFTPIIWGKAMAQAETTAFEGTFGVNGANPFAQRTAELMMTDTTITACIYAKGAMALPNNKIGATMRVAKIEQLRYMLTLYKKRFPEVPTTHVDSFLESETMAARSHGALELDCE